MDFADVWVSAACNELGVLYSRARLQCVHLLVHSVFTCTSTVYSGARPQCIHVHGHSVCTYTCTVYSSTRTQCIHVHVRSVFTYTGRLQRELPLRKATAGCHGLAPNAEAKLPCFVLDAFLLNIDPNEQRTTLAPSFRF